MIKKKRIIVYGCLLIGIMGFSLYFSAAYQKNKTAMAPLLRLHVIADSDSDYDQALKLEVRDSVIALLRDELKEAKDLNSAKAIITANLAAIEQTADAVLDGKADYEAVAMLETAQFPTKSYADLVLPAGEYEALRIVLGSGEGKNWWCVLFPSLCFVDAVGEVNDAMTVSTGKSGIILKWKIIELLRGE